MVAFESGTLVLRVLLVFLSALIMVFILRVYTIYRTMKINRTVMTPMLFAGLFVVLQGVTELTELFMGEIGHILHSVAMVFGAAMFLYGIYSYYNMLKRASQPHVTK